MLLKFLGLEIDFLQLMPSETHATNNRFIKSFIEQLGFNQVLKILELEQTMGLKDYNLVYRQQVGHIET